MELREVNPERVATTRMDAAGFEFFVTGARYEGGLQVYLNIADAHESLTAPHVLGHELDNFVIALSSETYNGTPLARATGLVRQAVNHPDHIATHPPEYMETLNAIVLAVCDWLEKEFTP